MLTVHCAEAVGPKRKATRSFADHPGSEHVEMMHLGALLTEMSIACVKKLPFWQRGVIIAGRNDVKHDTSIIFTSQLCVKRSRTGRR